MRPLRRPALPISTSAAGTDAQVSRVKLVIFNCVRYTTLVHLLQLRQARQNLLRARR